MVSIGTTHSSETNVYDANGQNTALVNRKADNSLIDTYSYTCGTNLLSKEMTDSTAYYMYNGHGDEQFKRHYYIYSYE